MASFTVGVSGTGPFTYQWQFNGTNLSNNIIRTVAGNGSTTFSGDGGLAINAGISLPYSVAFDSAGNYFIVDSGHNRIRKVDVNGIITTVAGGGIGGNGDGGQATNAVLNTPSFVVPWGGTLFIDDYANNRIRKVNTNGIITAVAGTGAASFSGDGGQATNATLYSPADIAVDNYGNVFIADFRNNRVRKVNTNGIITTIAGTGPIGLNVGSYSGDGGPATNANFFNPAALAMDAFGNIFVADTLNNRVRKVDTNGIVTTVAGKGTAAFSGDGGPATNASLNGPYDIAVDTSGNLFVSDNGNHRIREVTTNGIIMTVAGNGIATFAGDGGQATNASLNDPDGVGLNGNFFIADYKNNRVRAVSQTQYPTLNLFNVSVTNAGSYTVVVSNPSGSVTSTVAVLDIPCPPAAATAMEANGFVISATVTYGGCGYTNTPSVIIQGGGGSGATAVAIVSNGAVTGIQITNPGGNYVTNPIVIIGEAPAIYDQPQSLTVYGFAPAFFSVIAQVTGPTTYQWLFNGSNISGATASSLTISNVMQTNLGTYAVIVSNVFGATVSSNAVLTMYPYLIGPFSGLDTDWGYTNTLSVQAWGTGPLSYQWFFDGAAIAGATSPTYGITNIQFTNAGLYTVVVTNAFGSVTNTPEQVVVNPAGVSLRLSPTVVISGVVGYNYIIQRTAALSNTNSWVTVAQFTLTTPVELWVDTNIDASQPANPQQFYQVLPGQ